MIWQPLKSQLLAREIVKEGGHIERSAWLLCSWLYWLHVIVLSPCSACFHHWDGTQHRSCSRISSDSSSYPSRFYACISHSWYLIPVTVLWFCYKQEFPKHSTSPNVSPSQTIYWGHLSQQFSHSRLPHPCVFSVAAEHVISSSLLPKLFSS